MTPEKKLKYLSKYMDRWIEHYPHYKLCSFEVFVDLEERKRIKQYIKEQKEKKEAEIKVKTAKSNKCQYCERPFWWQQMQETKDHIIPKSKGGKKGSNLIKSCWDCNQWKANKDLSEWLAEVTEAIVNGRRIKPYGRDHLNNILINIRKIQHQKWQKAA
jgi:hypothetical protein